MKVIFPFVLSVQVILGQTPTTQPPAVTPAPLGAAADNTAAVPAAPVDPREAELEKLLTPKHTTVSGVKAVVLRSKDKDQALDAMVGSFAMTYAFITMLVYSDFPEQQAPVRTSDPGLKLLVAFDGSPRGRLFLVKAKSNSRTKNRSVKMGSSGYASISSTTTPDQDWVIPTTTKEVKPGLWEFTSTKPLVPGEYGIFASLQAGNAGAGGGELFDFGVDK